MQNLNMTFSVDELNLILEGLGNMPFAKVHQLISNIQQQASSQLQAESANGNGSGTISSPEIESTKKS